VQNPFVAGIYSNNTTYNAEEKGELRENVESEINLAE